MPELDDRLHQEIVRLTEKGNAFVSRGQYKEALAVFHDALNCIPEPKIEWSATMWVWVAIGDSEFLLRHYQECRTFFMEAVKHFDEARGNPFVRLRLGQSMLELGEEKEAANWLAGAFLQEGAALFEEDDPKYLQFIKSRLQAPPGGWPSGW